MESEIQYWNHILDVIVNGFLIGFVGGGALVLVLICANYFY